MNSNLTIEQLLRFVLAGILPPVAYFTTLAKHWDPLWKPIKESQSPTLTLVVGSIVLWLGCAIYSVHRSLVYPMFGKRLRKKFFPAEEKDIPGTYFSSDFEITLDLAKLHRQSEINSRLRTWGAQIHFLYTTAWAILLGLVVALVVGVLIDPCSISFWFAGVNFVLIFFFVHAASIHDERFFRLESEVFRDEQEQKKRQPEASPVPHSTSN